MSIVLANNKNNLEEFIINIGDILVKICGKRLNGIRENYRGFISERKSADAVLNYKEITLKNRKYQKQNNSQQDINLFLKILKRNTLIYGLSKEMLLKKKDINSFLSHYFFAKAFDNFKKDRNNNDCLLINRSILFYNRIRKEGTLFFLAKDNKHVRILEIDLALRVIYSKVFWHTNGLFFHCAGVIEDNKAYLFLGPGGIGKTTIAKKSQERPVLSDDMVGIRKVRQGYRAFATPWGRYQKFCRTNRLYVPIGSVFFLNKDKKLTFREITAAKAITLGLSQNNIFYSIYTTDSEFRFIFNLLNSFFRLFPAWEMSFSKNSDFWSYLPRKEGRDDEKNKENES